MAERLTPSQEQTFRALAASVRHTHFAARILPHMMDGVLAELEALRARITELEDDAATCADKLRETNALVARLSGAVSRYSSTA